MSFLKTDQVEALIAEATAALTNAFNEKINNLNAQLNELKPPVVESFKPVVIDPTIDSGNSSLDLIKSLPEFDGDAVTYPAWRTAAEFAMKYYPENSEKFYVATGILRNKVVRSANATLSSFNTVLNFKAILARLDLTYADKRPLHVLENELSILRQNNSSITDFYDSVDKQLTLIINKQIMANSGNDELIAALNERARNNALRVFISGLRRPLCDILFSAKPKDLPNALVTAQEVETNHRRNDFARTFAVGNFIKTTNKPSGSNQVANNKPVPMDVDSSRINRNANFGPTNNKTFNQNNSPFLNPYQKINNQNTSAIPKRQFPKENSGSNRSPFHKQQRINHMPTLPFPTSDSQQFYETEEKFQIDTNSENSDVNEDTEYENYETDFEEVSEKINFLE